jgi:hypothetical protein
MLPINIDGHELELTLVHPVYKNEVVCQDGPGKESVTVSVLDKELRVKRWFPKDAIQSIQECVTESGEISNERCLVFDKLTNQFYEVFHTVNGVRTALRTTNQRVGFSNHSTL